MKQGLIIFAREPLPGKVKSRLAASIGGNAAAAAFETMLLDVLTTARQLDTVETVVFWACEEASLQHLADKYRCNSRLQNSGNLGLRMQKAFEEMFADGYDICCIIGSDAPDLPLLYIQEAYRILATMLTDAVFGPSRDGGYYLLGMRQLCTQFFADISWSTSSVLEQSLAAASDSGLTTALLPEWQDIDTVEDLHAYRDRNRDKLCSQ